MKRENEVYGLSEIGTVACVERGHGFKRGEFYPVLGYNNGLHVCGVLGGEPHQILCHSYSGPDGHKGYHAYAENGRDEPPRFITMENVWNIPLVSFGDE